MTAETPPGLMAVDANANPDARRCSARSKRTGAPCKQAPIPGLAVCYWHGGNTRRARAAAARRVALGEAAKLLGIGKEIDPATALLEAVYLSAGDLEALALHVQQLGERLARDSATGAAVAPVVVLYERALERSAKLAALAVTAGLQERQVRLAEQQGAMVAALIGMLLADPALALTTQQQHTGRVIAASLLRQLPVATPVDK